MNELSALYSNKNGGMQNEKVDVEGCRPLQGRLPNKVLGKTLNCLNWTTAHENESPSFEKGGLSLSSHILLKLDKANPHSSYFQFNLK